jgi:hypothetical protein
MQHASVESAGLTPAADLPGAVSGTRLRFCTLWRPGRGVMTYVHVRRKTQARRGIDS